MVSFQAPAGQEATAADCSVLTGQKLFRVLSWILLSLVYLLPLPPLQMAPPTIDISANGETICRYVCAILNSATGSGLLHIAGEPRHLGVWLRFVQQALLPLRPGVAVSLVESLDHDSPSHVVDLFVDKSKTGECVLRVNAAVDGRPVYLFDPFTLRSGESSHPPLEQIVYRRFEEYTDVDVLQTTDVREECMPEHELLYESVFDLSVWENCSVEKKEIMGSTNPEKSVVEHIKKYLDVLLSSSSDGHCRLLFGVSDDAVDPSTVYGFAYRTSLVAEVKELVQERLGQLFPRPSGATYSVVCHRVSGWQKACTEDRKFLLVSVPKASAQNVRSSCFSWPSADNSQVLHLCRNASGLPSGVVMEPVTWDELVGRNFEGICVLDVQVSLEFSRDGEPVNPGHGDFVCLHSSRKLGTILDEGSQKPRSMDPSDFWYLLHKIRLWDSVSRCVGDNSMVSRVWCVSSTALLGQFDFIQTIRGSRPREVLSFSTASCRLHDQASDFSNCGLVLVLHCQNASEKIGIASLFGSLGRICLKDPWASIFVVSTSPLVLQEVADCAQSCHNEFKCIKFLTFLMEPSMAFLQNKLNPGRGNNQGSSACLLSAVTRTPSVHPFVDVLTRDILHSAGASRQDAEKFLKGEAPATWYHLLLAMASHTHPNIRETTPTPVLYRDCVDQVLQVLENMLGKKRKWALSVIGSAGLCSGTTTAIRLACCSLVQRAVAVCLNLRCSVADLLRTETNMSLDFRDALSEIQQDVRCSTLPILVVVRPNESRGDCEQFAKWIGQQSKRGGIVLLSSYSSVETGGISPLPRDFSEWTGVASAMKCFVSADACAALDRHIEMTKPFFDSDQSSFDDLANVHLVSLCMTAVLEEFIPVANVVSALQDLSCWKNLQIACFLAFFLGPSNTFAIDARSKIVELLNAETVLDNAVVSAASSMGRDVTVSTRSIHTVIQFLCKSPKLWHFGFVLMVLKKAKVVISETGGKITPSNAECVQAVFNLAKQCIGETPEIARAFFVDRDIHTEHFPFLVEFLLSADDIQSLLMLLEFSISLHIVREDSLMLTRLYVCKSRVLRVRKDFPAAHVAAREAEKRCRSISGSHLNVQTTLHRSVVDYIVTLPSTSQQAIGQLLLSIRCFCEQLETPPDSADLQLLLGQARAVLKAVESSTVCSSVKSIKGLISQLLHVVLERQGQPNSAVQSAEYEIDFPSSSLHRRWIASWANPSSSLH